MGLEKPAAPTELRVRNCGSRAVVVEWKHPTATETFIVQEYRIRLQYFKVTVDTLLLRPVAELSVVRPSSSSTCEEFEHPEEVRTDRGLMTCTVKATVQSVSQEGQEGGVVSAQTTWDEQCYEAQALHQACRDLSKRHLKEVCERFHSKKGAKLRLLVVGSQHHGKSSLINHLVRCFQGRTNIPDELAAGRAGSMETTFHTRLVTAPLEIEGCTHVFNFIDTPAFSNLEGVRQEQFEALLAHGLLDCARREEMREAGLFAAGPPHGAIVAVSLTQFVGASSAVGEYLGKLAASFKCASHGAVSFPYAVVVTHRDEFLRDCRSDRPHEAMQRKLEEIGAAADTTRVYALTNYRAESPWSPIVNEESFLMLRDILARAANEDTGRALKQRFNRWSAWSALLVVIIAVVAGAALSNV